MNIKGILLAIRLKKNIKFKDNQLYIEKEVQKVVKLVEKQSILGAIVGVVGKDTFTRYYDFKEVKPWIRLLCIIRMKSTR